AVARLRLVEPRPPAAALLVDGHLEGEARGLADALAHLDRDEIVVELVVAHAVHADDAVANTGHGYNRFLGMRSTFPGTRRSSGKTASFASQMSQYFKGSP